MGRAKLSGCAVPTLKWWRRNSTMSCWLLVICKGKLNGSWLWQKLNGIDGKLTQNCCACRLAMNRCATANAAQPELDDFWYYFTLTPRYWSFSERCDFAAIKASTSMLAFSSTLFSMLLVTPYFCPVLSHWYSEQPGLHWLHFQLLGSRKT